MYCANMANFGDADPGQSRVTQTYVIRNGLASLMTILRLR